MTRQLDEIRAALELRSSEELESILRNQDEEEWRPEVFAIVASILSARGVSTIDIAALGPESTDTVEGQSLVTVGHFSTPFEAHSARIALESAGITAWVTDETLQLGLGNRLQARVEDEAGAR